LFVSAPKIERHQRAQNVFPRKWQKKGENIFFKLPLLVSTHLESIFRYDFEGKFVIFAEISADRGVYRSHQRWYNRKNFFYETPQVCLQPYYNIFPLAFLLTLIIRSEIWYFWLKIISILLMQMNARGKMSICGSISRHLYGWPLRISSDTQKWLSETIWFQRLDLLVQLIVGFQKFSIEIFFKGKWVFYNKIGFFISTRDMTIWMSKKGGVFSFLKLTKNVKIVIFCYLLF